MSSMRMQHWLSLGMGLFCLFTPAVHAQEAVEKVEAETFQATVNSPQDGPIQPNAQLTLREAITVLNGTLPLASLSDAERRQFSPAPTNTIRFDLPPDATTIALTAALPAIVRSNLTLDGRAATGETSEAEAPRVTLTPAQGQQIPIGLAILGDRVTVRGLSLHGFAAASPRTAVSGNIVILSPRLSPQSLPLMGMVDLDHAPEGVVIEHNWLGTTDASTTAASSFGIVVQRAIAPILCSNRFLNHSGSAILTQIESPGMDIADNWIEGNGQSGMADAIRLEGNIEGTRVVNNQIRANGGSALYLFKPTGAIVATHNILQNNGTRRRQAAIFLMGNGHQVLENRIESQNGPGVVVAAYPQSDRNIIRNNRFVQLEGLSIDLIERRHGDAVHYQAGDGPNPQRNSGNRRRDTANGATNTPQFLSPVFELRNGLVNIDGKGDPGTTITLYRVTETSEAEVDRGPLGEPLQEVQTNEQGRFSVTLTGLNPGDRLSAIATDPQHGTSEPALNTTIQGGDSASTPNEF